MSISLKKLINLKGNIYEVTNRAIKKANEVASASQHHIDESEEEESDVKRSVDDRVIIYEALEEALSGEGSTSDEAEAT